MNIIKKYTIMLLMFFTQQIVQAQDLANNTTYYSEKLLGKKWEMTKTVNGENVCFSLTFDKDSVTNVIVIDNETTILRYAYYLSDGFEDEFDTSSIGKPSKGKWLNFCRLYKFNEMTKTDRANMKIFSLTDSVFSYGQSPSYPMVLTAVPLDN